MRVSTNTMYNAGVHNMTNLQSAVIKLNQQVAENQKVVKPSDDGIAAARALDIAQSQSLNNQYGTNRDYARSSLNQVEATSSQLTGLLQTVRTHVIGAKNGTYTNAEEGMIADELKGHLQTILGLANQQDGLGNYLFSGYQVKQVPFDYDNQGNIIYQGDQGMRKIQIGTDRDAEITYPGTSLFQGGGQDIFRNIQEMIRILDTPVTEEGNKADAIARDTMPEAVAYYAARDLLEEADPAAPDYRTLYEDTAIKQQAFYAADAARNPVSGSLAARNKTLTKVGEGFDALLENNGKITASVGARLNEIDKLDGFGEVRNINYTDQTNYLLGREEKDLLESISKLTMTQSYLQAAQQVYMSTSRLTLLNYM